MATGDLGVASIAVALKHLLMDSDLLMVSLALQKLRPILSSGPKCNTPADLIIGTVDQDLSLTLAKNSTG
jgi:hypothetical protein